MPRPIVTLRTRSSACADDHDSVGRRAVVERLASILGTSYRGDFDAEECYEDRPYFVPDDALDLARARDLGIASTADLFGGVVPHPFVATKAITHPLVEGGVAPAGWSRPWTAGSLIEEAGLKGLRIGGAEVSPLHANYFVNTGNATAADVRRLIEQARTTVRNRFGVLLEPEVKLIGPLGELVPLTTNH